MVCRNNKKWTLITIRYKTAKKHVKTLIDKSKADHYHECLKTVNGTFRARGELLIPSQNCKHYSYSFANLSAKVEEFSNLFSYIGECFYFNINANSAFRLEPVDIDTVILTVENLNATTYIGSDFIALRVLRGALCVFIPFLACIINTSIMTGVFPAAWNHTLVLPLYKSGNCNFMNNYIPVSILPIMFKVLEKIAAQQF